MDTVTLDGMMDTSVSKKWETICLDGKSYRSYPTIVVIATRGTAKKQVTCPSCDKSHEVEYRTGFHPFVVESWKRFIKPMNTPIIEMVVSGMEVGEAYSEAVDQILMNPGLDSFKHILFMEDDVIVPWMNNSYGPLAKLASSLDEYDVVSGLYWTKGEPSLPLVYGDGKDIEAANGFSVNNDWKSGDIVEVNGCGMGFTLMKRSLFEDPKLPRPFFKTVAEIKDHQMAGMTQDIYFYRNIKKLGYKIAVDTGVKCGHLDINTDIIY